MQNIVCLAAGLLAGLQVADVAPDRGEVLPLARWNVRTDFLQIGCEAGGVVIKADNLLAELQQGLDEM